MLGYLIAFALGCAFWHWRGWLYDAAADLEDRTLGRRKRLLERQRIAELADWIEQAKKEKACRS